MPVSPSKEKLAEVRAAAAAPCAGHGRDELLAARAVFTRWAVLLLHAHALQE